MPKYISIDNEKVSQEWYAVLTKMRHDRVVFNVNEGHRTMARQWYFWRLYRSGRGNLAAFPSPFAPHIRTGRIDHAIDFSNDASVFNWLHYHGLNSARRTVRGESWHIEISAAELKAYAIKHPPIRLIRKGSHPGKDIQTLQVLLRAKGFLPDSWKVHQKYTLKVRRAVCKFQKSKHMKVDGVVGPATISALRRK